MINEKEFIVLQYIRIIELFIVLQDDKELEIELNSWDMVAFEVIELEPFNKWSLAVEKQMQEVKDIFKRKIYKKARGTKPSNVETLMLKINKSFDQIEFKKELEKKVQLEKNKKLNVLKK